MPPLICPLCRTQLARHDATWRCAANHAFDIAREGYVNLLPVQRRRSREPGDNAAMVQARRDFLAAGHYAPLCAAIVERVRVLAPRDLLDIGCGEGSYTGALREVCTEVTGLDISKPAIRLAAKSRRDITWLVASGAQLPLADASVDLVCSFFSPLPLDEMARVLRPGGHLLMATPAPDHLLTLRLALFDAVEPHRPEKFAQRLAASFEPVDTREVRFPLQLDARALAGLLAMTPYAWRAKPERRAWLEGREALADEAVFVLTAFRLSVSVQGWMNASD